MCYAADIPRTPHTLPPHITGLCRPGKNGYWAYHHGIQNLSTHPTTRSPGLPYSYRLQHPASAFYVCSSPRYGDTRARPRIPCTHGQRHGAREPRPSRHIIPPLAERSLLCGNTFSQRSQHIVPHLVNPFQHDLQGVGLAWFRQEKAPPPQKITCISPTWLDQFFLRRTARRDPLHFYEEYRLGMFVSPPKANSQVTSYHRPRRSRSF